jgi:hypothetical protein
VVLVGVGVAVDGAAGVGVAGGASGGAEQAETHSRTAAINPVPRRLIGSSVFRSGAGFAGAE